MPIEGEMAGLVGGRYHFERRLGKGGVGEVFLAHDTQLERWVAVKKIQSESGASAFRAGAAISEAKHLASLQHPNIVTVYDFIEHEGDVLVVMEFVPGQTLEEIESPLTLEDFTTLAGQALDGLSAAHHLGLIHRDIKSANIMLASLSTGPFQVKILDFGLAKVMDQPSLQTTDHTGSLLGSIFTMAPEQLEQRPVDSRTDLYSLGCVFYRSLTRRDPFQGDTVAAVMAAHLQHRHESLAALRPDLPPGVCAWVERLFSWDPNDRPASASAAAAEFRECLRRPAHRPVVMPRGPAPAKAVPKGRSSIPWVIAAVVIALGSAGWILSLRTPESNRESVVALGEPVFNAPGDRADFLARVGKPLTIEGVIGRMGENKPGTIRYLNFEGGQRGDLALVFFLKNGNPAFSAERLGEFVGRRVRVFGTVTEFQGSPQIEIADLHQITFSTANP